MFLIPTIDEPMSTLTYISFWALISGIGVGATALVWWVRQDRKELQKEIAKEVERINERIDKHDTFVNDTQKVISETGKDVAVTREAVENLEEGIKDIKKSITALIDKLL